ncbi:unnamed protein product, partial [Iphiclides podalirius]
MDGIHYEDDGARFYMSGMLPRPGKPALRTGVVRIISVDREPHKSFQVSAPHVDNALENMIVRHSRAHSLNQLFT